MFTFAWRIKRVNAYQKEQLEALNSVRVYFSTLTREQIGALKEKTIDYIAFRKQVDLFLNRYFDEICTENCYKNRLSACCSKDGIITFFADTVINCLFADEKQLDRMASRLLGSNEGFKCVYLDHDGCLWSIKPIVCAMFLCENAKKEVFLIKPEAEQIWKALRRKERSFKWPDKPVLFDMLETCFLNAGYKSSLMHLNNSPGLLNVKRKAGLI